MKKIGLSCFKKSEWLLSDKSTKKIVGGANSNTWKGTKCTDYEDGTFCCEDSSRDNPAWLSVCPISTLAFVAVDYEVTKTGL